MAKEEKGGSCRGRCTHRSLSLRQQTDNNNDTDLLSPGERKHFSLDEQCLEHIGENSTTIVTEKKSSLFFFRQNAPTLTFVRFLVFKVWPPLLHKTF